MLLGRSSAIPVVDRRSDTIKSNPILAFRSRRHSNETRLILFTCNPRAPKIMGRALPPRAAAGRYPVRPRTRRIAADRRCRPAMPILAINGRPRGLCGFNDHDPLGNWLASTLVAALPIVVLLGLLATGRASAWRAALTGLAIACGVAWLVFGMPAADDRGQRRRSVWFSRFCESSG